MNDKKIYGITGTLGTGKSTLAKILSKNHINPIKILELDNIRRHALWHSNNLNDIELRKELSKYFNIQAKPPYFKIDRTNFTKLIFSSKQMLKNYSLIATPFLKQKTISMIENQPISFIVWTNLIEEKYIDLVNKKVIILESCSEVIYKRACMQKRFSDTLFKQRLEIEYSYANKKKYLLDNNILHIDIKNNDSPYHFKKSILALQNEL